MINEDAFDGHTEPREKPRDTGWQPGTNCERRVAWIPGYDCRVKCEHEPPLPNEGGQNHGQHGDELRLFVRHEDCAGTLVLYTFVRRGQITHRMHMKRYGGGDQLLMTAGIYYHYAFRPVGRDDPLPQPCDLMPAGHCYPDGGRMLTSVAEHDDLYDAPARQGTPPWVVSNEDFALLNDEAFLVHPEVEHRVLAMTTGLWERHERDLGIWRLRALGVDV